MSRRGLDEANGPPKTGMPKEPRCKDLIRVRRSARKKPWVWLLVSVLTTGCGPTAQHEGRHGLQALSTQ